MRWRTEIRLNFRRPRYSIFRILGRFRKINVGFRFELAALLMAYNESDTDPVSFTKLDPEKQITALCYGAAVWDCVKTGKKVFFTYDDICIALDQATKEENKRLAEAIQYAQFPEWLKGINKK